MNHTLRLLAPPVLLILILAGCDRTGAPAPAIQRTLAPSTAQLDHLKELQAQGNLEAIAREPVPCTRADDDACAQAQQIRADACLTLARRMQAGPEQRSRLDCAVDGFAAAAASLPRDADDQRRVLLQRNVAAASLDRLNAGGPATDADRQLASAEALLSRDPGDPYGCYHLSSARLSRALALPQGPARCRELTAVPAACNAASPQGFLRQAQQLAAQMQRQKRDNGCG
jgi:hypothetical protein